MAGNTIQYNLEINDASGSMQKRTKEAKAYHDQVSSTQKLLSRQAAYRQESIDYGASRALGMGTGASGRDFAKESQGLGGLVRLYATFAANIFAVTAAFQQLSSAMDTSNMIAGMRQLGAVSGVSLLNISKNLVAATDGAISMRDAMQATAMASSAGLNAKQIEDIGLIAKSTSQALGRDMTDSITRLTRGVVKLEPELLDELGLFTKIGPAAEKYALSIGKSVSQLTDFERRQAFANAVIKEGLDKFATIKLEANPYSRLLATLKDVAFVALDLINKVLKPLVNILSENPTALATILAAIAVNLTSRALPAIANFNTAMRESAQAAVEAASRRAVMVEKVLKKEMAARIAAADMGAEAESMRWEKTSSIIEALAKDRAERIAKATRSKEGQTVVQGILGKSVAEITPAELATLDELGKRQTKVAALYRDLAAAKRQYDVEAQNYEAGKKAAEDYYRSQQSLITTTGRTLYQVQQENQRARSQEITSNAAATTSLLGLRAGWQQLTDEIAKARSGPQVKIIKEIDDAGKETGKTFEYTIEKMSGFRAATTTVVGGLKILTQYISNVVSFLGIWGQAFALASMAVAAISSYFAKATKEIDAFDKSLDKHTANLTTYTETLDSIYSKNPSKIFDSQSIIAQANAVNALGESLRNLITANEKAWSAVESGSWVDKFEQGLKTLLGKNIDQKTRSTIAETVGEQIKQADRDLGKGITVLQQFSQILGVPDPAKNIKQIKDLIKDLDPTSPIINRLSDAWAEYSKNLKASADAQSILNENIKKADESFQRFMQQYAVNDPFTRFVIDSSRALGSLSDILTKGSIQDSAAAILQIIEKLNSVPFFTPEQMSKLDQTSKIIQQVNTDLGASAKRLDDLKQEQAKAQQAVDELPGRRSPRYSRFEAEAAQNKLEDLNQKVRAETDRVFQYQLQVKQETNKFLQETPKALTAYGQKFTAVIAAELSKGSTAMQQAVLSKAQEFLPEASKDIARLKIQELNTQITLIQSNLDLIKTIKMSDVERRMIELERQKSEKETILATMAQNEVETPAMRMLREQLKTVDITIQSTQAERQALQQIFKNPGKNFNLEGMTTAAASNVFETQSQLAGGQAQINRLRQSIGVAKFEGDVGAAENAAKIQGRINDLLLQAKELETQNYDISVKNREVDLETVELGKKRNDQDLAYKRLTTELDAISARQTVNQEVYNYLLKTGTKEKAETYKKNSDTELSLARQNALQKYSNSSLEIENDYTNKINDRRYDIAKGIVETNNKLRQLTREGLRDEYETQNEIFDILASRGIFTDQEIRDRKQANEVNKVNFDLTNKLNDLEDKRSSALEEQRRQKFDLRTIDMETYNANVANINREAAAEGENAVKSRDNKLKVIDLQYSLNAAQDKYLNLLGDTMNNLTDSIVNFAKTGKFAFKDFVTEALAGLLKLQLQMTIIGPLQRSLLGSLFPSIAGVQAPAPITNLTWPGAAKGAMFTSGSAFFAGVDKYAKGGLLNSPTLFSHSAGKKLAIAGEAGDEFVMPAGITRNGMLGVHATGGKTEINIYNNAQTSVETKENVDSRGNRSFDIVISNLVANNMAQPGSSMQQSLRGTYGLSPSLVRR